MRGDWVDRILAGITATCVGIAAGLTVRAVWLLLTSC